MKRTNKEDDNRNEIAQTRDNSRGVRRTERERTTHDVCGAAPAAPNETGLRKSGGVDKDDGEEGSKLIVCRRGKEESEGMF